MSTTHPDKKAQIRLNPNKTPLTPDVLKSFEGFDGISDEEAQEIVNGLQAFARILFDLERTGCAKK